MILKRQIYELGANKEKKSGPYKQGTTFDLSILFTYTLVVWLRKKISESKTIELLSQNLKFTYKNLLWFGVVVIVTSKNGQSVFQKRKFQLLLQRCEHFKEEMLNSGIWQNMRKKSFALVLHLNLLAKISKNLQMYFKKESFNCCCKDASILKKKCSILGFDKTWGKKFRSCFAFISSCQNFKEPAICFSKSKVSIAGAKMRAF